MSDLRQQLLKAGLVSKEAADAANQPPSNPSQARGQGGSPRGQTDRGDAPRGQTDRGDAPRGQQARGDGSRGPQSQGRHDGQPHGGRPNDGRRNDGRDGQAQRQPREQRPNDLADIEKAAIEREQKRLKQTPEERRKAEQLALKTARAGRIDARLHGPRRWYYNNRDGVLGWVDLTDDLANQVDQGRLAIVESPRGEAWLIGAEAAAQLAGLDQAWLRFWQTRH